MKKYQIIALLILTILHSVPSLADTDYRAEFFSWVWMPCMCQLVEDKGVVGIDNIYDAAIELHSKLEGEHFNKQAWET